MKRIAFFDFDGTITTHDTMFSLIRNQAGDRRFYRGFLMNLPTFLLLKLKLISAHRAKEKLLGHFFRGLNEDYFQTACDNFALTILPSLIRPGAIAEIEHLKAAGFEVTIVSASAQNWIRKWAETMDVKLITSKLEIVNGLLTGRIDGFNCNKAEKVNRINEAYDLSKFDEIYCYGDSSGDKPMLALATRAFYKPFRK